MPFAQRLTCTIDDACEVTGLGRTKLYELIGAGRIVTTTIGRRRLVVVRSLLALLDQHVELIDVRLKGATRKLNSVNSARGNSPGRTKTAEPVSAHTSLRPWPAIES